MRKLPVSRLRAGLYVGTGIAVLFEVVWFYSAMGSITTTVGPWWRNFAGTILWFAAPMTLLFSGVTFSSHRRRFVAVVAALFLTVGIAFLFRGFYFSYWITMAGAVWMLFLPWLLIRDNRILRACIVGAAIGTECDLEQ